MEQHSEDKVLAAVDLGSNSFHMIIAQVRDGHFHVMDRLRDMVQLRAGLDERGRITDEAQERALACLSRFGERVASLPSGSVSAIGTNTLRVATNAKSFMGKAHEALGHPIRVVTGEEEARLIYLGVAHSLAFDSERRLVMDIGGGSTEFIIGEGVKGLRRESLSMGCVSFTQRFFAEGTVNKKNVQAAELAARVQLRDIRRSYREMGWVEAVGASGSIRCVASVVAENGWSDNGSITPESLEKLKSAILAAGHVDSIKLDGLSSERAPILPAGVMILKTAFDTLRIKRMTVSDGALREGALFDLVGRAQHDDVRDRTVQSMAKRYHVDDQQSERVKTMALQFLDQVAAEWKLDDDEYQQRLSWAADLHEIGLAISHGQRNAHAAYLAAHSDMSGFSREEQQTLATIIYGQRQKFPKKRIAALSDELRKSTRRLTVLLRLALVFNRGRSEHIDMDIGLKVKKKKIKLVLPENWLDNHPLTASDLLQEASYLEDADFKLSISEQ